MRRGHDTDRAGASGALLRCCSAAIATPRALAAARVNVGARYKPIQLENWDAGALPLGDASVNKIVTNLPWGLRYGSHGENRKAVSDLVREFARVLKSGGMMVMLTAEWRLMRDLERTRKIAPSKIIRVSVLGKPAAIYVCRKANRECYCLAWQSIRRNPRWVSRFLRQG